MIILCTIQVSLLRKFRANFTRSQIQLWQSLLLDLDKNDFQASDLKIFYTLDEVYDNLHHIMNIFDNLEGETIFDVINLNKTSFKLTSFYDEATRN